MILPEKKEDPKKRYYAAGSTVAFCLLFFAALVFATVTDPESTRVYMTEITELNITRFQPEVPEPEVQEEPEEPMAQEESPADTEVEEVNAPQRIDMSEVLPEGVQVDLSVNRAPSQTTQSRSATQNQSRSLRLEESEMETIGGLQSLSGSELSSPTAQRRSLAGDAGGTQGGIGIADGPEINASSGGISDGGGTGGLLSGPEVREGNTEGMEVGLKDISEFGDGYSDMDPIYNKLVEWMKKKSC
ncbi:MAG: hypothetical protein U5K00_15835 [Melioribacteraceae bacterium]|nr:hypothetical protein [Melioribacteraceae bacterium]